MNSIPEKTSLLSNPDWVTGEAKSTRWKTWGECNTHERWVIVGKIALAVFLAMALAAACVFTGFAGLGLIATLAVATSLNTYATVGAVFGVAIGLGIAATVSPYFAYRNKLHQYHEEENKKSMFNYTMQSIGLSAVSAGLCAGTSAAGFVGIGAIANALPSVDFAGFFAKIKAPSCGFNFKMPKFDPLEDFRRFIPNKPPSDLPSNPPSIPSVPPSMPSGPPSVPGGLGGGLGGGMGGFGGI